MASLRSHALDHSLEGILLWLFLFESHARFASGKTSIVICSPFLDGLDLNDSPRHVVCLFRICLRTEIDVIAESLELREGLSDPDIVMDVRVVILLFDDAGFIPELSHVADHTVLAE